MRRHVRDSKKNHLFHDETSVQDAERVSKERGEFTSAQASEGEAVKGRAAGIALVGPVAR